MFGQPRATLHILRFNCISNFTSDFFKQKIEFLRIDFGGNNSLLSGHVFIIRMDLVYKVRCLLPCQLSIDNIESRQSIGIWNKLSEYYDKSKNLRKLECLSGELWRWWFHRGPQILFSTFSSMPKISCKNFSLEILSVPLLKRSPLFTHSSKHLLQTDHANFRTCPLIYFAMRYIHTYTPHIMRKPFANV